MPEPALSQTPNVPSDATLSGLSEVLSLPRSGHFGVAASGSALTSGSLYGLDSKGSSDLSFDVSNNQLAASLNRYGVITRACICNGVAALPPLELKGGVYCTKSLLYGQTPLLSAIVSGQPGPSERSCAVSLVESVLPLFSWDLESAVAHSLIFAPVDPAAPERSPRALIQLVFVENKGSRALTWSCPEVPEIPEDATQSAPAVSKAAAKWITLDGPSPSNSAAHTPPGKVTSRCFAWILAENSEEVLSTTAQLRAAKPKQWLAYTLATRRNNYGALSIPEDSHAAETMIRFSELCRQSLIRRSSGQVAGGFLGSDPDTKGTNWNKDTYFSSLAMSIFDPMLCRDAIQYFLDWGHPAAATGDGVPRMPGVPAVSQSLSNSLSGLVLACHYYRATDDKDFFRSRPEILRTAQRLLDATLSSRRGKPVLFPSLYYSDGEARGDYHTGSNLIAWSAFDGMTRIAKEVYRNDVLSAEWESVANGIRRGLEQYCVSGNGAASRFHEGAHADGSHVAGHDGEESDTNLMSFYGFCDSRDPRLLNHKKMAMSSANPYYAEGLDALWWYNSDWRHATAPGWMTALAGAENDTARRKELQRIRGLTDLDGSLWWWPYRFGTVEGSHPLRGDGARKSGWTAAVYLCRFIHDILGISVDAPAHSASFSTDMPWTSIIWDGARVGHCVFDIALRKHKGASGATIVNRNAAPFTVSVTLRPLDGRKLGHPVIRIDRTTVERQVLRANDTVSVTVTIAPKEALDVSSGLI